MERSTTNFEKHSTANPISKFFLNNFYTVLIEDLKKLNVASVLDVGCGEGFTLSRLEKEKIGEHNEGIEYVDEAIKIGRKLYPKLVIKKGDIYHLPYGDNSFDAVLCNEVLEHLEEPDRALEELKRVSKKYVLLSVPNEPLFTIQRILRGKNVLHFGDHPEHIQHWSNKKFAAFVSKYLKVKLNKTPLPWTFIVAEKRHH